MRLKSVTLRNFRCFEEAILDLHPRLTVLVGDNGSGKTALLDALVVGLSPILYYLSSAEQRLTGIGFRDTDFRLEKGTNWKSDYIQIEIKAHSEKDITWDISKKNTKSASEPNKLGQKALMDYINEIFHYLNSTESVKDSGTKIPLLPIFTYYGTGRGGHVKIPKRTHSNLPNNYEYPPSALVNCLEQISDFKELLQWFDTTESSELRAQKERDRNQKKMGKPKPQENNSDQSELETDASKYLMVVRKSLEILLGKKYSDPRFNSKHKFVVNSQDNDLELELSQLSQGYQSMLGVGMDFARRLAIGNRELSRFNQKDKIKQISRYWEMVGQEIPDQWEEWEDLIENAPALMAPGIMLIDEIDLHLHPSWQQRVLSDLMSAFPATQFIVTTHSPQILSTVPAECIRRLEAGSDNIEGIEEQTQGMDSAYTLAQIMDVDPIPKHLEPVQQLNEYKRLIQDEKHGSDRGRELRQILDKHFGAEHPVIKNCERTIKWVKLRKTINFPKA